MRFLRNLFGGSSREAAAGPELREVEPPPAEPSPLWVGDFGMGWTPPQLVDGSFESGPLREQFLSSHMLDDAYAVARLDVEHIRQAGCIDKPEAIKLLAVSSRLATLAGDAFVGERWARQACDTGEAHTVASSELSGAYMQLANSFHARQDLPNALACYDRAIHYLADNLGADHPKVGQTQDFRDGLERDGFSPPEEPPELADIAAKLAQARREGNVDQVEMLTSDMLQTCMWGFGMNHPQTGRAFRDHADALMARGYYHEAHDPLMHFADLSILHTGQDSEQSAEAIGELRRLRDLIRRNEDAQSSSLATDVNAVRSNLHLQVYNWEAICSGAAE